MSEVSGGDRLAMEARVIQKAWKDDAFRRELLNDPKGVIEREFGIIIPPNIKIFAHEESMAAVHFVLPINPYASDGDRSLSDEEMEAVIGGVAIVQQCAHYSFYRVGLEQPLASPLPTIR